jgi:cytoskeletal protein RodZ
MADVSNRLRAARERAGLAIEDLSARTKIKVTQLKAIEQGQFERLPGEFFTRAFLRTYARELRLPPDEIVREYDEGRRAVPARVLEPAPVATMPDAPEVPTTAVRHHDHAADESPRTPVGAFSPRKLWPAVAFAVLVLLVAVWINRQPHRAAETGAVNAVGGSEAMTTSRPAATSGRPPEPAPEKLTMHIAPTAEIWINATADGQRAVYRLVQPGERLQLEARNELSFRIGNAAAFQYSINGAPGRVLGQPGEVVEFQVTRDNVRSYRR